jgi:hypothetical protein
MVRFGNTHLQSVLGVVLYAAVLVTVGTSIFAALSPLMA